tara:strand:+ start:178 stop:375 length:198 start_codon:yes stop_codon:yes gene_type:complete
MKKGTVKFFNHTKGFGFINEEGGSQDYFVHSSGLAERIQDGDMVEFELEEDPKGMRAINVKLAAE